MIVLTSSEALAPPKHGKYHDFQILGYFLKIFFLMIYTDGEIAHDQTGTNPG